MFASLVERESELEASQSSRLGATSDKQARLEDDHQFSSSGDDDFARRSVELVVKDVGNGVGRENRRWAFARHESDGSWEEVTQYYDSFGASVSEDGAQVAKPNANRSVAMGEPAVALPENCRPLAVYYPDAGIQLNMDQLNIEDRPKKRSEWVNKKLKNFSTFLGVSCEGFEEKTLALLEAIESRW